MSTYNKSSLLWFHDSLRKKKWGFAFKPCMIADILLQFKKVLIVQHCEMNVSGFGFYFVSKWEICNGEWLCTVSWINVSKWFIFTGWRVEISAKSLYENTQATQLIFQNTSFSSETLHLPFPYSLAFLASQLFALLFLHSFEMPDIPRNQHLAEHTGDITFL